MNKRGHYIGRGLMVALMLIQTQTHAIFGFGESNKSELSVFIPAHSIDSTSIMLAQSAMSTLGNNSIIVNSSDTIPNIADTISLLSYDIITAVQSSNDKAATITDHVTQLQQQSTQLEQINKTSQSKADQATTQMNECITTKKNADMLVIKAINEGNIIQLDTLIAGSVNAGTCEAENRIKANARNLVIAKNQAMITQLTRKANLIEQYQSTIIQYPEIILNPDIIEELSQISSQF